MNRDIFTCSYFRELEEMGNFAWIKICVFSIARSLCPNESNFQSVHIFADIPQN